MNRRFLSLCGMIAPAVFLFTAVLGGAMRPGYSHVSETVSELFSPGSPNKPLLDTLHTVYALLMILFGVGVLQFVRRSEGSTRASIIGAWLFIAAGVLSLATATVFPQDPWGSPPSFRGQMHLRVSGVLSLLSLLSMALIATWIDRAGMFAGFKTYSFVTIVLVVLSAEFFAANVGTPIIGLAERITILVGFQWTFVLALWMFSRSEGSVKIL